MNPGQVFHALIQERSFSNGGRESARRRTAFGVLAAVQVTLIAAITVGLAVLVSLAGAVTGPGGQSAAVAHGYGVALRVAAAALAAVAAVMTMRNQPVKETS